MPADFQKIQLQLAEHLRDPDNNPPPAGLESRRLEIYRRLFFNNIVNFITKTFPVLTKLYTQEQWLHLIRFFYAGYTSHSPYFSDISKSFVEYLSKTYEKEEYDPPFLAELAHYEWAEFALAITDEEINWEQINPTGDLLTQPPVLSPLAWHFTYHWRVHQISPQYRPHTPDAAPTHLILCRKRSGKVHFILINETTNALFDELEKNPLQVGREHIENVITKLNLAKTDKTIQSGYSLLEDMREREIILGTAKSETA